LPAVPDWLAAAGFRDEDLNSIVNTRLRLRIPERDPQTGQVVMENGQPKLRPLAVTDQYVSARDIYENNDRRYNWGDAVCPQDEDEDEAREQCVSTTLAARVARLNFTAQPSLAASYGLMQVMYVKALEVGWKGVDGKRNPSLLFDTEENLRKGSGSVEPGSMLLQRLFGELYPGGVIFGDYQHFLTTFKKTYSRYNPWESLYENDIVPKSPEFHPISDHPVLEVQ
jgi:hypothetical protein